MTEARSLLLYIRCSLCGTPLPVDILPIEKCISLAHRHGVDNMLYFASPYFPDDLHLEDSTRSLLKKLAFTESVRESIRTNFLCELYQKFEFSKIRCIPLKGVVLKELYPKAELRHMSDIDLLIDPSRAADVKIHFEELGAKVIRYDQGDTDQYLTPEGLNFEVKRTLQSESFNDTSKQFLAQLLARAKPWNGYSFVCRLSDEDHYAYLLCHIVKHLINGGIGIRSIVDVWICTNQMSFNYQVLNDLLEQLELTYFSNNMRHLANVWFGNELPQLIDEEIGKYIIDSGAFGTEEQRITDRMIKKSNRISYLINRLFPSYKTMIRHYPSLKKAPVLMPFYWIWRLIYGMLFRRAKLLNEVSAVGKTDKKAIDHRVAFFKRCGLNFY